MTDRAGRGPTFLARGSYRQRRLQDLARLLPVMGIILFFLPLAWRYGPVPTETSGVLVYIFAVWIGLILMAFYLSRAIRPGTENETYDLNDEMTTGSDRADSLSEPD